MSTMRGRWSAVIAAVVLVAALVGGVVIYQRVAASSTRALCADLPDSAGLYVGNAVNIRGVRVGTVTSVEPAAGHVTVGMNVDDRPLSAGFKVVAVNNSVLADRRLELVGTEARGGAVFSGDSCVPRARAFTPISVSTAFQSFTEIADKIGGAGTDSSAPVGNLLTAASKQLDGTGRDVNEIIENLSGLMADPNHFLAQMRTVFDNMAVLTQVAGDNWDAITDIGTNAASLTFLMGRLFEDFVYIFIGLGQAGPGLDDLLGTQLPPILDLSETAQPVIDVAVAHTDDLKAILENIPGIAAGLDTSVNRNAAAYQITYRAPTVAAATPSSSALCAVMNRVDPGSCDPSSSTTATVDLGTVLTRALQGGLR